MKIVIDIHDVSTPAEAVARLDEATHSSDIEYDVIGVLNEEAARMSAKTIIERLGAW